MDPPRATSVLLGELATQGSVRSTNAELVKEVRRKLKRRACEDAASLKEALRTYATRNIMPHADAFKALASEEPVSERDFMRAMTSVFHLLKKKSTGRFTSASSAATMRETMSEGYSLLRCLKDVLEVDINGNRKHGKAWSTAEEDSLIAAIKRDGCRAKIDERTHESCVLHANKLITIKLGLTAAEAALHFGISLEDATKLTSPAHRRPNKQKVEV